MDNFEKDPAPESPKFSPGERIENISIVPENVYLFLEQKDQPGIKQLILITGKFEHPDGFYYSECDTQGNPIVTKARSFFERDVYNRSLKLFAAK